MMEIQMCGYTPLNTNPKYTQNISQYFFTGVYSQYLKERNSKKQITVKYSQMLIKEWASKCCWWDVRASEACSIYIALGTKIFNQAFDAFPIFLTIFCNTWLAQLIYYWLHRKCILQHLLDILSNCFWQGLKIKPLITLQDFLSILPQGSHLVLKVERGKLLLQMSEGFPRIFTCR